LWIHVTPHFRDFLQELELTPEERADADGKAERIARCLWDRCYPGAEFNFNCFAKVGSYGKGTASRPPSDLDMLFVLPPYVYGRVEALAGNKQSKLLQAVKRALEGTFPRTDLRADGQVVFAPFQSYNVEIIPAFLHTNGTYYTAHTADGGSWRLSNPHAEYWAIKYADSVSADKATHLLKMLKAWKRECSVDIRSISLEVLVCDFVRQWEYRLRSLFYYDWLIRDFFAFMLRYQNGSTIVPGTPETIQLGDAWVSKCRSAYDRALRACHYEVADADYSAAAEWQRIFGAQFRAANRLAEAAFA